MIDHLAVRDREDPAAQVRGVPELRVGAQRSQPRLLVAVVGVDAADTGHQEAVDIAAVGVEQGLKGRQAHW
jgi:hypothetical protein